MSEEEIQAQPDPGGTEIAIGSGGDEVTELVELPDTLPVLPLKNTVLFPFLLSPLLVNTERSRRLIDSVLLTSHRLLVCVAVRRPVEKSPGPDDLYRVGTVMRIAKMLKFPDDSYRLLVQGIARVRIDDFVQ
jgi:ATP-dependent Lon protease